MILVLAPPPYLSLGEVEMVGSDLGLWGGVEEGEDEVEEGSN